VAAAKQAFKTWSNTPFETRAASLLKFADLLEAREKEFAVALTSEQGKPIAMALGEVRSTVKKARNLAKIGNLIPDVTHEDEKCRFEIHYTPRGVVGG
jgi:acyl-CoA reductase-like NAD-dependent aldehyde dehydrogenase